MDEKNDKHGDPEKANSVAGIFKKHHVAVVANKAFGPNINRIKKQFLPILLTAENIEESVELFRINFTAIKKAVDNGNYEPIRL